MARRRKTKGRHARGRFSTIHPDAAGIDVGSRFHVDQRQLFLPVDEALIGPSRGHARSV